MARQMLDVTTDILAPLRPLFASASRTQESLELIFISIPLTYCYRDTTSASNPEITSKSSSSMPLWRNW